MDSRFSEGAPARRYTRRGVVGRGGVAVGALGLASVAGVGGLEAALAAASGGLSPARRRTYGALVEAVSLSDHNRVSVANLGRTVDRFDDLYRGADPNWRRTVEISLDLAEKGSGRSGFAQASARARLERLRRWAGSDAQVDGMRLRDVSPSLLSLTGVALPSGAPHAPPETVTV
jgi:hypothetical protein